MVAFQREQASRTALGRAVSAIGSAKGKYDFSAMIAEEEARKVLDDRDNGLSPSEKAEWSDRIRFEYKAQAYLKFN